MAIVGLVVSTRWAFWQIVPPSNEVLCNRPPEDWRTVFPDPVIGGPLLYRLVSGAEVDTSVSSV
jgi:hypothetical protein